MLWTLALEQTYTFSTGVGVSGRIARLRAWPCPQPPMWYRVAEGGAWKIQRENKEVLDMSRKLTSKHRCKWPVSCVRFPIFLQAKCSVDFHSHSITTTCNLDRIPLDCFPKFHVVDRHTGASIHFFNWGWRVGAHRLPGSQQLFPAARRFFPAAKRVFFRSDVFFLLRTCVFRYLREDKEL